MTRRPDPDRIETARRQATVARLVGAGHGADRAERLVERWLAELGRQATRSDWEGFDGWLERSRPGPRPAPTTRSASRT